MPKEKKTEMLRLAGQLFSTNRFEPLALTVVGTAIASALLMGVLVSPGAIAQVAKIRD